MKTWAIIVAGLIPLLLINHYCVQHAHAKHRLWDEHERAREQWEDKMTRARATGQANHMMRDTISAAKRLLVLQEDNKTTVIKALQQQADEEFKNSKARHTAEDLLSYDVRIQYVSVLLVNDTLDIPEALTLMKFTHDVPIYGDFPPSNVPHLDELENISHDVFLNDDQIKTFLRQSMGMRRHWYRMRGLLRLALRG